MNTQTTLSNPATKSLAALGLTFAFASAASAQYGQSQPPSDGIQHHQASYSLGSTPPETLHDFATILPKDAFTTESPYVRGGTASAFANGAANLERTRLSKVFPLKNVKRTVSYSWVLKGTESGSPRTVDVRNYLERAIGISPRNGSMDNVTFYDVIRAAAHDAVMPRSLTRGACVLPPSMPVAIRHNSGIQIWQKVATWKVEIDFGPCSGTRVTFSPPWMGTTLRPRGRMEGHSATTSKASATSER